MTSIFSIVAVLMAAGGANGTAVSPEEGMAWCKSYTEASGIPDKPCECVVEKAETDAELAAELYAYKTKDEFVEKGSPALKELIGPCISGGNKDE